MKKQNVSNGLVKVDKGVPIPKRQYGAGLGTRRKYQWLEMAVGDSFLLPSASAAASQVKHANYAYAPRVFEYRKTPEGLRVWRME